MAYNAIRPATDHAQSDNTKRRRLSDMVDPLAPPPSKVVHVRAVPDGALNTEMRQSLMEYGNISHLILMPERRQALVEFEAIDSAILAVSKSKETPGIQLKGRTIYLNFSKSQEINRGSGGYSGPQSAPPNRVLLISVQNPIYPVDVNVLHSICNPYGSVLRIVVMRRRGVQALIEFDDVGTATRAKEALHNQDIYAGCNTLKVEYSTSERVNVRYNTEDMWDYTGQNLQNAPPQRSNSFSQPGNFGGQRASFGGAPDPYGRPGFPQGGAVGGDRGAPGRASFGGAPEQFGYGDRRGSGFQGPGGQWGGQGGAAARPSWGAQGQVAAGGAGQPYLMPGSVVMMYQLDAQRFNVNTLFNWMCLFANPHKIKFLVQKPGTAMIQFGHPQEAQDAMTHAHETVIFGQKVECAKSRSDDIKTPMNTKALDKLPDGTDCFKDFSQSKNLRYPYQPGQPRTRRPCNKSATVHYFNAPKNCDLAKLRAIFTSVGIKAPGKMERFVDDETKRTDRGLMEWDSIVEATEAIIMGNHFEMQGDDQQTYTIKLAYSSRSLNPQTAVQFDAATGAASALEGGATAVGAEITQGSGDGAAAPTGDADAQVEFKTEASADGAEASGETQQEE